MTTPSREMRVGMSGQTVIVNDEATQEGYSFSVPYPADARLFAAAPRMKDALQDIARREWDQDEERALRASVRLWQHVARALLRELDREGG